MNKKAMFFLLLMLIVFLVQLYFKNNLNLGYIKIIYVDLQEIIENHPLLSLITYAMFYVVCISFSLPVASLLTLLAGALFGFWVGFVLVSFSSSIGATVSFLFARYCLKDYVIQNFPKQLKLLHKGFNNQGARYLFTLRLLPIFPFFLVNIMFSMLPIRAWTFYWVSQLSMIPGTVLYVSVGTHLSSINDLSEIMSFKSFMLFFLLAFIPWLQRWYLGK